MISRKTKYLLWFMALVTILACVPGGSALPAIPTIDPNLIGTYIAQTANAASTQTARALPTLTATVTLTPTPRFTDTPEPTATNTVIFVFFTPSIVAPVTSTVNATSNQPYSCQVLSVTPAIGKSFAGRTDFDATWKVRNNGQRNWNRDVVDYVYLSGQRMQKVDTYDLQRTVRREETIDLIVDMVAPKNAGTYSTTWTMRSDTTDFCSMGLTIVVR